MAELLLQKGYDVYGIVRRASTINTSRIDHLYQDPHEEDYRFRLVYGDMTDGSSLNRIIRTVRPDEIYSLAAQSHVKVSFEVPEYTADVVALGTLRLLEAVRDSGLSPCVYIASSSEMFGDSPPPQNEQTPFRPRSPYACAKVFAHQVAVNYREAYDMHISCGVLFNHGSPRRGETFVTRKIAKAVARIKLGLLDTLYLGNLDARRDWGHARDYVLAMWLMLQKDQPDDYVIATGEMHSVREFAEEAFAHAGLDWQAHVKIDPRYFRPTEVDELCGNASKARQKLGWVPRIIFKELVHEMVDADLNDYEVSGSKNR